LARDAYSYLHLPMVAGIVFFAFGLETTVHHTGEALFELAAVALCGGGGLYLLAPVAFLFRAPRRGFRRRPPPALGRLAPAPARTRATGPRSACARQCRLLLRRRLRGDPAPDPPAAGPPSGAHGVTRAEDEWQLEASSAELYERYFVPTVTLPWAVDLVDRVG